MARGLCAGPGGGARQGRAAPRPQAGQRHDRRHGPRPARGLRPRRCVDARVGRRARGHAGLHGAGAVRAAAGDASSPTSTRSASCSTRCSPASRRSPGTTVGELARQHRESDADAAHAARRRHRSAGRSDHPALPREGSRCSGPSSALPVAAALPGGDPLAAALAAGETPSPEMVAAVGRRRCARRRAWRSPCLAAALVGASAGRLAEPADAGRSTYLPTTKPPAVLADTARTIVHGLGYHDPVHDAAWGFTTTDYLQLPRRRPRQPAAVREPASRPAARRDVLVPAVAGRDVLGQLPARSGRVHVERPRRLRQPGMVAMMLDLKGRLHFLDAVPPRFATPRSRGSKFDWNVAASLRPDSIRRRSRPSSRRGCRRCSPTRARPGTASTRIAPT